MKRRNRPVSRPDERNDEPRKTGSLDFEQLMAVVSHAIRTANGEIKPVEDRRSKIESIINEFVSDLAARGTPVPPKMVSDARRGLEFLRTVPERLASSTSPGIHPTVAYLLYRNYEHLRETVGADVALDVIRGTLRAIPHTQRGRPKSIPITTLLRMKTLHDGGKSYAQIAKELGLPRQRVRTALEHHYREKKSR